MAKAYQMEFAYTCKIKYYDGSTEHSILQDNIKYIMFDYDYENRIMPIGYLSMTVSPSIYNSMVKNQGKGKIYLNIYGKKTNGYTSTVNNSYISESFDYIMGSDPNAYKKLDEVNSNNGTSYRSIRIGLIKKELTERNQKIFEGIYKETNIASLVKIALSDQDSIIEPLYYNTDISELIIPRLTTVGQFLSYLNSQYSFYKGSYTYFLDFDRTYLIANDGEYVDDRSGDYKTVSFDIRDLTSYQSVTVGMADDRNNNAYVVFINANDASIGTKRSASIIASNITAVNNEGTATEANIETSSITNIDYNINANYVVTSNDPNAAQNLATRVEEDTNILMVTKTNMNAKVFTPNKVYLLSNYEDKPSYCGIYYMVAKQEIFLRVGQYFNMQETISLKKIADFQ